MDAEAIAADQTLNHAYGAGRADEREEWLPLGRLVEKWVRHNQDQGAVTIPLEGVLELSKELARLYK